MDFSKFLFREVKAGSRWQLICPVCWKPGDIVNAVELSMISFMGESSICIYCDPRAEDPIPYVVSEVKNGGNSSPVSSERVLEVDCE